MISVLLAAAVLVKGVQDKAMAAEPFKAGIDCIAALRDCSKGAGVPVRAGVVDMVVMNASRDGKDGFYLFAPEDAYFHEFPPAPPVVEAKEPPPPSLWNLYGVVTKLFYQPPPKPNPFIHYKAEAGIHDVLYLAFKRGDAGAVALESASTVAGPSGTSYLPGGGGECHADAAAAAALTQEALARIRIVFSTYSSSPEPDKSDVSNEYNIAGHDTVRTFYNRDVCFKGLSACLDGPELKTAAAEEQAKFPK